MWGRRSVRLVQISCAVLKLLLERPMVALYQPDIVHHHLRRQGLTVQWVGLELQGTDKVMMEGVSLRQDTRG